jgi:hypothetical protein
MSKKTQYKRGDVIQVDWLDAHSKNGWWQKGDTKWDGRGFPVTHIATVVEDTKNGITLTLGFAADDQSSGAFFIPRGMIQHTKLWVHRKNITPCWEKPYGQKAERSEKSKS